MFDEAKKLEVGRGYRTRSRTSRNLFLKKCNQWLLPQMSFRHPNFPLSPETQHDFFQTPQLSRFTLTINFDGSRRSPASRTRLGGSSGNEPDYLSQGHKRLWLRETACHEWAWLWRGERRVGKALGTYRWRHNVALIANFLLISLILFFPERSAIRVRLWWIRRQDSRVSFCPPGGKFWSQSTCGIAGGRWATIIDASLEKWWSALVKGAAGRRLARHPSLEWMSHFLNDSFTIGSNYNRPREVLRLFSFSFGRMHYVAKWAFPCREKNCFH